MVGLTLSYVRAPPEGGSAYIRYPEGVSTEEDRQKTDRQAIQNLHFSAGRSNGNGRTSSYITRSTPTSKQRTIEIGSNTGRQAPK